MYYTNGKQKMVETVVALLMFIGPDIIEHRIQPRVWPIAFAIRGIAERRGKSNVQYKCVRSKSKFRRKQRIQ